MPSNSYRLTTIDNPYSPFTQFDSWFLYDVEKGYNTCGLLDRMSNILPGMSEQEEEEETQRAIDEIIKDDFMNIYKKVKK